MRTRPSGLILVAVLLAAATVSSQPQPRRATTIAAIRAYPGFYHQQTVLVIGEVKGTVERATIGTDEGAITLIARELPRESQHRSPRPAARSRPHVAGRSAADSLQPARAHARRVSGSLAEARRGAGAAARRHAPRRRAPSTPARHRCARWRWSRRASKARRVTIVGQFRGRNLFGELPEAPAKGKYEFVLRSADAALWVIGLQPKGKGFNFDPGKRIDTGRWVTVQGTVRTARGLTWLEGTSIDLAPTPRGNHRGHHRPAAATAG